VPNPLGRRRGGQNTEVEQLKKELEELKSNYARDVNLISEDIRAIASQVSPAAPAEDTPAV
jgi:hypothetical protein